ncbi:MAG TPA: maleylpyruvate isomerase family mycothiol-dependent enzyme [Actinocatenispora sp.]
MTLTGARPDKAFWLTAVRQESAALRAAATPDALDAPVPSCPGWTVATLLRHTGGISRWVADHVTRGVTSDPGEEPDDGPAEGGDALLTWWDGCVGEVLAALDRAEPDLPAWNWAPRAKVATFWYRRWAHELAVHRWDAQVSVGLPEPIETALAVDGVAEVLDTWLLAHGAHADRDGVVQLIATDTEDSWIVRVRGNAVSLLDTATLLPEDRPLDTQASGTASDLVLALYGRVPFEILDVTGDEALLDALRVG